MSLYLFKYVDYISVMIFLLGCLFFNSLIKVLWKLTCKSFFMPFRLKTQFKTVSFCIYFLLSKIQNKLYLKYRPICQDVWSIYYFSLFSLYHSFISAGRRVSSLSYEGQCSAHSKSNGKKIYTFVWLPWAPVLAGGTKVTRWH